MVARVQTFSLDDTFLAPQILNPPPTRHALLAFLLALTAVLHIGTAAWGDLNDGAEGQLAGGAREMLDSKQWLLPTNDGTPLLQTPPLAYWATAISFKVFGLSAAAARLPIALAMLGSVALTFLIGERLAGYWPGFAAGLIHVCSAGAFLPGRMVTPDSIFSLFIAAAIYCVVRGYQQHKSRRAWFAGMWIAAGLASLTKGPSALVYLAMICGLLAILFREARLRFGLLLHGRNLLLFVLLVAPWFVWAQQNFPGFLSHFPGRTDAGSSLPRWRFLLFHFAWWFPAIFLVLPGLILAPRKIFRPNEFAFADALPLVWMAVGLVGPTLAGERHVFLSLAAAPGFALFAASSWERLSRPLRVAGIAVALVAGVAIGTATYYRPAVASGFLEHSINTSTWIFLSPLAQIAVSSLVAFAVGALLIVKQRGEITLVVALAAMVPVGFCLVEARSQAAPFFSLADAAQYVNPRLGRNGEVVYEGSLPSGSSLSFYLDKKFFLVNQAPAFFDRDPAAQKKYLDEHFLLDAWDGSNPVYLIIDEDRVSYWRKLITTRVHIYHQVTTCGSRVILSNQL
jgi:4-amino-4-deoxy-L-arabinose transferase-like glycosyltransferase